MACRRWKDLKSSNPIACFSHGSAGYRGDRNKRESECPCSCMGSYGGCFLLHRLTGNCLGKYLSEISCLVSLSAYVFVVSLNWIEIICPGHLSFDSCILFVSSSVLSRCHFSSSNICFNFVYITARYTLGTHHSVSLLGSLFFHTSTMYPDEGLGGAYVLKIPPVNGLPAFTAYTETHKRWKTIDLIHVGFLIWGLCLSSVGGYNKM